MPDPPNVGWLTRWVLENPWPLGVLLLAVGMVIAIRSAPNRRPRLLLAAALAAAGAAIVAAGAVVVTAGEQAEAVTRDVIDAVVAGDAAGASSHIAGDATIAFGSITNPGHPRDRIDRLLDRVEGEDRIDSNRITMLDAYTESARRATVHLACVTTATAGGIGLGNVPTQWVLEIERQPDGSWKITRVTCISLAGQRVPPTTAP